MTLVANTHFGGQTKYMYTDYMKPHGLCILGQSPQLPMEQASWGQASAPIVGGLLYTLH